MIQIKREIDEYSKMLGKRFKITYRDEFRRGRPIVGRLDNFSPSGITVIWDEEEESIRTFPSSSIRYMELVGDVSKKTNTKVKIIETNLIMSNTGIIEDHQARIVEANSWDEYISAFKNYDGRAIEFKSLTPSIGNALPRKNEMYNLEYDYFHLSCDLWNGIFKTKKLAYLIE